MKNKKDSENEIQYMPIAMCLGISIGTALGVATDNMPVFMCLGLSIGMCIGSGLDYRNKNGDR